MSKPGVIYRITQEPYYNHGATQVQDIIDISDNDNLIADADDPQVVDLIPSGEPISNAVTDNSIDPFTVIKSQTLTMRFNSDNGIDMNTFASGSDNRWSVHNYIGGKTIFKGFLDIDNLSQYFMPDPNIVELTANDGLGTLKEIPWTDDDGNSPVGEYTVGEIIAMCLKKTGLSLPIKAAFNIKAVGYIDDISIPSANDQHFFTTHWLNAKSYEDKPGVSINCYDILQRILGDEATVFQRQGYWWIMRIDEVEHPTRGLYITEFDSDGKFVANLGEKTFEKRTGKDAPYKIFFTRERTLVNPKRQAKSVKTIYDLEYPSEIVDNFQFERGDVYDSVNPLLQKYRLNDWVLLKGNPLSTSAVTSTAYIERAFSSDGYETDRYAVITPASAPSLSTADETYLRSNAVYLNVNDKFDVSVDWRIPNDLTGAAVYYSLMKIVLVGVDGKTYLLGNVDVNDEATKTKWYDTALWTSNTAAGKKSLAFNNLKETDWNNTSFSAAPVPVAGKTFILLHQFNQQATGADNINIHYSNLNFELKAYIAGTYIKYSAFTQEVSRSGAEYKAKRETNVHLSEGRNRNFKGALLLPLLYVSVYSGSVQFFAASSTFQISGYHLDAFRKGQRIQITTTISNNVIARVKSVSYSIIGNVTIVELDQSLIDETHAAVISELTFELATRFYNAAVFPAGPPSSDYIHPYSEIQVFDIWNQFWMEKRIFQATMQGQDLDEVDASGEIDNAHLIHKWILTDPDQSTINRFFTLLTFDQDHRTVEWTGVLREVYKTDVLKQYTGRVSKYIS